MKTICRLRFNNSPPLYIGSTWSAVEESETVVREEKKGKLYRRPMSALALAICYESINLISGAILAACKVSR